MATDSADGPSAGATARGPTLKLGKLVDGVGPELDKDGDAYLVLIYPAGPDLGRRFKLTQAEYVLGRDAESDIPVDRDSVSRRHAVLIRRGGVWCVEDLKSTNGTYVNDVPITSSFVQDGDCLKLGSAIFKFLRGSSVEANYHEELYRLTIVDPLTGAFNRRALEEFLDREMARCYSHQRPLSLVRFDVSDLQEINAKHGQVAGDDVLREVYRRVQSLLGKQQPLARLGGGEFAVILPEMRFQEAEELGERFKDAVAAPVTRGDDKVDVRLYVSAATLDLTRSVSVESFVAAAEADLKRARRSGQHAAIEQPKRSMWSEVSPLPSAFPPGTALVAIALNERDVLLAQRGGERVEQLERALLSQLKSARLDELSVYGLEGGGKLLVSLSGRDAKRRLALAVADTIRKSSAADSDARFSSGPVCIGTASANVLTAAINGLNDELAIVEHGRYLPAPIAAAYRALDEASAAPIVAKYTLELGEILLRWLALTAAAELVQHPNSKSVAAAFKRHLTAPMTIGKWREVFACAAKELTDVTTAHSTAWKMALGSPASLAALLDWLNSLAGLRNAFTHDNIALDERVASQLADGVQTRLRSLISSELRPVLRLIPADMEFVSFEGELKTYWMTRLIGDGSPSRVPYYSRNDMNKGLWLCDPFMDATTNLEPFFLRETCPTCGARELFLLDQIPADDDHLKFKNPSTNHVLRTTSSRINDSLRGWLDAT